MSSYLITGGAGFVGSNLVRQLQEAEPHARLLVIDDFRSGSFANLASEGPGGWSYRGGFIARPLHELDLFEIVEDFEADTVFHLASITDTTVSDQAKMVADNVEPFESLLRVAVEYGCKLVWASSAATYGRDAGGAAAAKRPFALADAGRPANVYGFSKWVMENLHRETLAEHPEAHLVGLRYFNVFGPGEAHKAHMASMIYQLARQMLEGKRPRMFRDGEQARDHVYVKDVVDATIAAGHDRAKSGIYNVGAGEATTFNQIAASLNAALGTSLEPDYFENPYPFYQDYTCADLSETRKALKWSPKHKPAAAIAEYARWLKENATAAPSSSAEGTRA